MWKLILVIRQRLEVHWRPVWTYSTATVRVGPKRYVSTVTTGHRTKAYSVFVNRHLSHRPRTAEVLQTLHHFLKLLQHNIKMHDSYSMNQITTVHLS